MVPSRLTSISMVKDRKSLLMIDFLPSNYMQAIFQMNYLVPLLLHKVHGGQSFLKKQQQNFLRTMMESLVEILLMLLEFWQECRLYLTIKKNFEQWVMTNFGKSSCKQQKTIGQWLLEQIGHLQATFLNPTPTLFLEDCNLPTRMDPTDLNLSKSEIHMVRQDITKKEDHGDLKVTDGQSRT